MLVCMRVSSATRQCRRHVPIASRMLVTVGMSVRGRVELCPLAWLEYRSLLHVALSGRLTDSILGSKIERPA